MPPRPHSISELANFAKDATQPAQKSVKDWLRLADALRKQGQQATAEGDIQAGFLYLARSATYILEKIPKHPNYDELTETQMANLKSNGHEILHNLEQLKPRLADRYEQWLAKDPANASVPSELLMYYGSSINPVVVSRARRQESFRSDHSQTRAAVSQQPPNATMHHSSSIGDLTRDMNGMQLNQSPVDDRRARAAAEIARRAQEDAARRQWQERQQAEAAEAERRRVEEQAARIAQEEAARRQWDFDEFERRQRDEQRRASEYERAQQVRNAALDAARKAAGDRYVPQSSRYQESSISSGSNARYFDAIPHHPLQDPSVIRNDRQQSPNWPGEHTPVAGRPHPYTPLDTSFNNSHIEYPQLMSAHQRAQGYQPSVMFSSPASARRGSSNLYNITLPHQSPTVQYPPPRTSSMVQQSQYSPAPPPMQQQQQQLVSPTDYYANDRNTPKSHHVSTHRRSSSIPEVQPHPLGFRPIDMPAELLDRFLGVAHLNTLRKIETCGLLLGKQRGAGFTISTLLIPEQRGTTDTCIMECEELVVEFSTGRDLLTLGWIHTHPTQSCFMSSLDLHTHSAYQSTLKEAIAIVCAPSSDPRFGIFRLTDPPGLDVVMNCRAKETFHPHPENIAIYTDCDGSHVRLVSGMHLEIVDLRNRHDFSSSEGTAA
ncbi:hypothetical protein PIIN_02260 [Serendipita indica DSM 11827]|uniref:MPN domain-containing protein n=1 Tax=Serendipita indica (strain DSM 11827) TaxID=1109443 RepID=G4TAN6_SERID|nr:hypothetical protein PIIN_02260 [Serendipita indica DSM 11827]